jgi:hypothetical protein
MVKRAFRIALVLPLLSLAGARAQQSTPASSPSVPVAQRIAHTNPAKYHHMPSVHNGAGRWTTCRSTIPAAPTSQSSI